MQCFRMRLAFLLFSILPQFSCSSLGADDDFDSGGNAASLSLVAGLDYWIVAEGTIESEVTCRFGENLASESVSEGCVDAVCARSWEVPRAYEFLVDKSWREDIAAGDLLIVFFDRYLHSTLAENLGDRGALFLSMSLVPQAAQPFSECPLAGAFQAEHVVAIEADRPPEYYQKVRDDLDQAAPRFLSVATGYRVPDCLRRSDVYFEDSDAGSCTCPVLDLFVPENVTGFSNFAGCPEHLQ
jgi:hypothetical protein